ncbi:MAG: FAD-dependent monooxygenase [bacterium]|nr:FAD-dependent monooxygenase [bacterium]
MDRSTFNDNYNVVIVGAGPAGSSAAIRLARSGRNVLLVDKASFPRHKLCGEFVSPECLDHLEVLGVIPQVDRHGPQPIHKTVFYSSGGRSFSVSSRWLAKNNGDSIGLSRRSLDQILLDRAGECGVDVLTETSVLDLSVMNGQPVHLSLRSSDGVPHGVTASIVIDATGRGRYVAKKFDAATAARKAGQVAFKAHLQGARIEPGACEIFSYPGGYGGCSQVEGGVFNLCFIVDAALVRSVGSDPIKVLEATVLKNRRAAEVLADIAVEGEWISVPIVRYGSMDPAPSPGIIAIGDAAAFIDPFTGSGISMALESSRIACKAIMESEDLDAIANAYRISHAAAFGKRLRTCRALRFLSNSPKIADAMITGFGTSEPLRRFFARLTRSNPLTEASVK